MYLNVAMTLSLRVFQREERLRGVSAQVYYGLADIAKEMLKTAKNLRTGTVGSI